MKGKKLKYLPPVMEVTYVEMEFGIASGSATVTPGGRTASSPWNPEVQQWEVEGQESNGVEL